MLIYAFSFLPPPINLHFITSYEPTSTMTNHLYLLSLLPTMLVAAQAEGVAPQWVPLPKTVAMGQGSLVLTPATRILTTNNELEPLAKVLADEILLTTGGRLATAAGEAMPGAVVLQLDPNLKGETYSLEVAASAIIKGGNYQSVASGTVTLLQALRVANGALTLPQMHIADEPVYPYRGALIDPAREVI